MSVHNGRALKFSVIGILITLCGALLFVIYEAHSQADLNDRKEIGILSVKTFGLEVGLMELKQDVKAIKKDTGDTKMFLLTGEWP